MLDTPLNPSFIWVLLHFILVASLWGRRCYYSPIRDIETEAWWTWPRPPKSTAKLEPRQFAACDPFRVRQCELCQYSDASHLITQLIPLPWNGQCFQSWWTSSNFLPLRFALPIYFLSPEWSYMICGYLEMLVFSVLNETHIIVGLIILAVLAGLASVM